MSNLSAFLNPIAAEEQEVFVSERFVQRDEAGKPILDENGKTRTQLFRIRPLTQEENESLVKAATYKRKGPNGYVQEFDRQRYSRSIIVAATVFPDFKSTELCEAYGVLDPVMVPSKMLYAGEYQRLADAIAQLSGIGDESAEEEAKN